MDKHIPESGDPLLRAARSLPRKGQGKRRERKWLDRYTNGYMDGKHWRSVQPAGDRLGMVWPWPEGLSC